MRRLRPDLEFALCLEERELWHSTGLKGRGTLQLRPVMTKEDLYAERLAWFKENERPEAVLVVADDPERIKGVVAC